MTKLGKIGLAVAFAVALAAPAGAAGMKQIKSAQQFAEQVVDRKLVHENGTWFIIRSNGKIDGRVGKQKFVGAWQWNGRHFCRNGRIGTRELGTNCQVIRAGGGQMQFFPDKGKTEGQVYTVE